MVLTVRFNKRRLKEDVFLRRSRARSSSWSEVKESRELIGRDTSKDVEVLKSKDVRSVQHGGSWRRRRGGKRRSISSPTGSASFFTSDSKPEKKESRIPTRVLQSIDVNVDPIVEHSKEAWREEIPEPSSRCDTIDVVVEVLYSFLFPSEMGEPGSMGESRGEKMKQVLYQALVCSRIRGLERSLFHLAGLGNNEQKWLADTVLSQSVLIEIVGQVVESVERHVLEGGEFKDGVFVDVPELLLFSSLLQRFPKYSPRFARAVAVHVAENQNGNVQRRMQEKTHMRRALRLKICLELSNDVFRSREKVLEAELGGITEELQEDPAMQDEEVVSETERVDTDECLDFGILLDLFVVLLRRTRQQLQQLSGGVDLTRPLNSCFAQLLKHAPVGSMDEILRRLLWSWPSVGNPASLLYLELADTLLHLCPVQVLCQTTRLVGVFERLEAQLISPNSQHVRRAIAIFGAPHVVMYFMSQNQVLLKSASQALFTVSKAHWCASTREGAEELFDALLDFA